MIEYQVDEQMLEEVQAKLGEMSRKAPTVISRALNKVAVTARVDLANKAQATYTVKSGGFKKDMTIRKASAGRLEAVIHSQGKPLSITKFHTTAETSRSRDSGQISAYIMHLFAFSNRSFCIAPIRSAADACLEKERTEQRPRSRSGSGRIRSIPSTS